MGRGRIVQGVADAVEIGELGADDVLEVARLLGLLFAQEAEFVPDATVQERALRRVLDEPALGVVLVAREAGRVVGSVLLLRTLSTALGEEVCLLEDMVVAPEARGRGIGGRLLDAALAAARQRGWARVTLLTDADNEPAQRFYARHGFERSTMIPYRRPST